VTVVQLAITPEEQRHRQGCIDLLARLLEEAKKGRGFDQVFIVATFPDSEAVRQAWTRGLSTITVVGTLEHVKHELLATMHESDAEGPSR
jgi:hypothetical protein